MQADGNMKMTFSCVLPRGKEKIVRVQFEGQGTFAEGLIPDGTIIKQKGFSKEEVDALELYLKMNKDDIMKKAKEISGIKSWF